MRLYSLHRAQYTVSLLQQRRCLVEMIKNLKYVQGELDLQLKEDTEKEEDNREN